MKMRAAKKKFLRSWQAGLLAVLFVWGGIFFCSTFVLAEKIPFAREETLAQVRDKIQVNGYHFTVADNWVTRLPADERQRLRSRHAPAYRRYRTEEIDYGPLQILPAEALPESFDWRNVDGHSYIGPMRDPQGSCGVCYAFAACAAAEGTCNVALGRYDSECLDLSEAFLAFCLDQYYEGFSGCWGSDFDYRELDALVEHGVCLEVDYPYSGEDRGCIPGAEEADRIQLAAWYRIPCGDILAIKSAIKAYGVLDAAVRVTSAFEAYHSGVFTDDNTGCSEDPCYYTETDHCIALVGWQDTGPEGDGYWILRNSWGRDWGEDGYMKIAYRSAHVACEACYLVYTGPDKIFVKYDGLCNGFLPCFSSVTAAYAAAGKDSEIKVRDGSYYCSGGVVFAQEKNLRLTGGWNETFTDEGSFTYLYGGPLQIEHGSVVVNRIILGDASVVCCKNESGSGFSPGTSTLKREFSPFHFHPGYSPLFQ
ncbi:MAG: hypothetical protein JXR80_02860 [Deltaproteobacteria bacterium]|nr:hypothetical protein [Deltaproteobacteria bacterium]